MSYVTFEKLNSEVKCHQNSCTTERLNILKSQKPKLSISFEVGENRRHIFPLQVSVQKRDE